MAIKLHRFLSLQSDTYLLTMRDKLSEDLAQGTEMTSLSMGGKTVGQRSMVKVEDLCDALVDVLVERNLQGTDYTKPTRMTKARFT